MAPARIIRVAGGLTAKNVSSSLAALASGGFMQKDKNFKKVQSMFLAILTLETNEIQRMFWFASDYSNTAFQFQEVLRMNTNIFNLSLDT